MTKNYCRLSRISRRLMFGSYAAVLLVFTLGTLVVPSCDREPNTVIWLLHCLPLLAFLPAMIKHNPRALAWLCFLLLFYFLLAVLGAFTCVALLTNIEVGLIVVLFVATMLTIRWHSLALKQQHASLTNADQESVE